MVLRDNAASEFQVIRDIDSVSEAEESVALQPLRGME
jgi:hypothetical protein